MAVDREGKGSSVDILEFGGDFDRIPVEAHGIRSFGRDAVGGFEMSLVEVNLVRRTA